MQYLLMIMSEEGRWGTLPESKRAEVINGHAAFGGELTAQGKLVVSRRLSTTSMATTVRMLENGERVVQDGPFSETKEVLGGFYLIDCASQREAIEWARKLPIAYGAIEGCGRSFNRSGRSISRRVGRRRAGAKRELLTALQQRLRRRDALVCICAQPAARFNSRNSSRTVCRKTFSRCAP